MTHKIIPVNNHISLEPFADWTEQKVQDITIQQLRATHPENDASDKPLKGIYHYELIDSIMEMADKYGYNPLLADLFAAQNQDRNMPGVSILKREEPNYGVGMPQTQILRRVYANINLPVFDDGVGEERNTGNISVSYTQGGIQLGFGPHVYVCHNQTMLGANQSISTFGAGNRSSRGDGKRGGATVEQVLQQAEAWLRDAPEIMAANRRRMAYMKQIPVTHQQWLLMLGGLNEMRAISDSKEHNIREQLGLVGEVYPFSQTQLNALALNVGKIFYTKTDAVTLWDIYNAGTEFYKPMQVHGRTIAIPSMDMANILPQNEAYVNFLNRQYAFMEL